MVKKKSVELQSIEEIENKIIDLKLELAKYKGMLASKTKTNNTAKKGQMKKEIARLLTKKNSLVKNDLIKKAEEKN